MFFCFNARAIGLDLSARETIQIAAEAGFPGVDLLVRDIAERGEPIDELVWRMSDLGLRPGAFPLPMNWRADLATFERDLADLPRHADAAARLGLRSTGTWVMPETPTRSEDEARDVAETARIHRERLAAIARILSEREIRLGLEVIGVRSFPTGRGRRFVARLDELEPRLGAISEIGPNVGVLIDAFHLYAADEPIASAFAWGVDRIVWVHLADLPPAASTDRDPILDHERGLPGENGAVENRALVAELNSMRYAGPVTVEPLARCRSLAYLTPPDQARVVLESVRRIWPNDQPSAERSSPSADHVRRVLK